MNTVAPNDYSFFEKPHDLIQGELNESLGPDVIRCIADPNGPARRRDIRTRRQLHLYLA